MKKKQKSSTKKDGPASLAGTAGSASGRRYSSVIAMMVGEKMPIRVINGVKALMARDRLIAHEFYQEGASVKKLARKYALKPLWVEDIIRVDGLIASSPNTQAQTRHD